MLTRHGSHEAVLSDGVVSRSTTTQRPLNVSLRGEPKATPSRSTMMVVLKAPSIRHPGRRALRQPGESP